MTTGRVSIVLLTRNGATTLPAVLEAIWRQRTTMALEVIAVDSGSTDGTLELLRQRVTDLIEIPPGAFNHGLTRNLGIEHTTGEFVVLLVQDAVPLSDQWLAELVAPLLADERVAGTFARQRPRPDASALTRHFLTYWVAAGDAARTVEFPNRGRYDAMTPMERLLFCAFDNVCSCVRRSVWAERPFRKTTIAEDVEWARDGLLAGQRIAYVPTAEVMHSHDRSARYEFARTYVLHRRLYELFGLRTIPTSAHLARSLGSAFLTHARIEWRQPAALPRALALAVAWPFGQYLGARSSAEGRRPLIKPGVV